MAPKSLSQEVAALLILRRNLARSANFVAIG
jgi:hypothetical protein